MDVMYKQVTEQEYLIVMFANVIADNFGTHNYVQYLPVAENLYNALKSHADKTLGARQTLTIDN